MIVKNNKLLVFCILFVLFSISAYAVLAEGPALTATKEVHPSALYKGDTTTVTFMLETAGGPSTEYNDVDVVLTIDKSSSMRGEKLTDAKVAANSFLDIINTAYVQGGVASFAWDATLNQQLTTDKQALHSAINSISASGGTAMGEGMGIANDEMLSGTEARPDAIKVQVLMSDGHNNIGSDPITRANEAATAGIIAYTIAFGRDADEDMLQNIADITGGEYYFAPDGAILQQIYKEIAEDINNLVGKDVVIKDVLPEGVEIDVNSLPAGCTYDEPTRTVTCDIGLVSTNDRLSFSFNVAVYDFDLTQVNENSSIYYYDYQGNAEEIIIDPQPQIEVVNRPPIFQSIKFTNGSKTSDENINTSDESLNITDSAATDTDAPGTSWWKSAGIVVLIAIVLAGLYAVFGMKKEKKKKSR